MIEALLKGLTFGMVLSISVGPVLFSIIKQSLNNGHRGGMAFVLGVSASDITLVLICNIFTELFVSISKHETSIRIGGCLFLVTMGIFYLFFKKVKLNPAGQPGLNFRKRDYAQTFLSGYLMNTLNPSVFIFWLYMSTQIVSHTANEKVVAFVACLAWMLGADILKVFLAGKIRNRLTPHNIHILNKINGALLIIFGIALVWGLIMSGKKLF
jgi:threonine/homoserine/homoserine lactone efflux protein